MTIAENLSRFMNESGITNVELSRRSGVSAPYISQIRTGQRTRIGLPYLLKLARGLGKTIDELVTGVRVHPINTVNIDDEELRSFFSGNWDELADKDKEWVRGAIRIALKNLRNIKDEY